MERRYNRWHDIRMRNSLICLVAALAGISPLVYQSYCYQFHVDLNSILNSSFGVLGGLTLFCIGPVSFMAWVVGAFQGRPDRILDVLRSVVIGCLIGFWLTISYVMRK